MSGWAQRDAEAREQEVLRMEAMQEELKAVTAERDALAAERAQLVIEIEGAMPPMQGGRELPRLVGNLILDRATLRQYVLWSVQLDKALGNDDGPPSTREDILERVKEVIADRDEASSALALREDHDEANAKRMVDLERERDEARAEVLRVVDEANGRICRILTATGQATFHFPLIASRLLAVWSGSACGVR